MRQAYFKFKLYLVNNWPMVSEACSGMHRTAGLVMEWVAMGVARSEETQKGEVQ